MKDTKICTSCSPYVHGSSNTGLMKLIPDSKHPLSQLKIRFQTAQPHQALLPTSLGFTLLSILVFNKKKCGPHRRKGKKKYIQPWNKKTAPKSQVKKNVFFKISESNAKGIHAPGRHQIGIIPGKEGPGNKGRNHGYPRSQGGKKSHNHQDQCQKNGNHSPGNFLTNQMEYSFQQGDLFNGAMRFSPNHFFCDA